MKQSTAESVRKETSAKNTTECSTEPKKAAHVKQRLKQMSAKHSREKEKRNRVTGTQEGGQ